MRQDYTGAEVTGYGALPTRSGGDRYSGTGSFGIGDLDKDRYNVLRTLSYQEQKPLEQRARNFSNTSLSAGDRTRRDFEQYESRSCPRLQW